MDSRVERHRTLPSRPRRWPAGLVQRACGSARQGPTKSTIQYRTWPEKPLGTDTWWFYPSNYPQCYPTGQLMALVRLGPASGHLIQAFPAPLPEHRQGTGMYPSFRRRRGVTKTRGPPRTLSGPAWIRASTAVVALLDILTNYA